ncbi:hypothetical protein HUJ04_013436 [Dendroctonus ponderosae]|nr:hypothetical protein HUJ04_013436 [Dendroctonus ponderosae]
MSHLRGLPPLPKSLSGLNFVEGHQRPTPPTPVRTSSIRAAQHIPNRQPSSGYSAQRDEKQLGSLDSQLAVLRREMYSLRQQDLSLLSQLWLLNESIQDFRQALQDQRVLSPLSPSPTASSLDDEEFYMSSTSMG